MDDRGVEQPNTAGGALTVAVAPVLPPPIGLRRTPNDPLPEKLLTEKLTVALDRWPFSHHCQPAEQRMRRLVPRSWRPVGGSYVAAHPDPRREPEGYGVEMEVDARMAVRLRAAGTVRLSDEVRSRQDTAGNGERPLRAFLDEYLVVRYLVRTLAFAAGLLTEARYLGAVDVGIALTRTRGTLSWVTAPRGYLRADVPGWAGYADEEYRRTDQVSSARLVDHPQEVARDLLQDLFDALAQGDYPSGEHPIGVRP